MAKSGKRKGKKRGGGGKAAVAAGGGMLAGALGNVLGNMIGQLMADGVESLGARRSQGGGGRGDDDVAGKLLTVLSERGPQSIPDLIAATEAGLTPVLHALQTVKDFRLVDFVNDGEMVQLTQVGNRTVTVLQKGDIRKQAARLLEA